MTTISLPVYAAVALAGIGFVIGEAAVRHIPQLRDRYVPEPLIGGLAVGLSLVAIRAFGWSVEVPDRGTSVDFLVALLTTNMGLHLTPLAWFATGFPPQGCSWPAALRCISSSCLLSSRLRLSTRRHLRRRWSRVRFPSSARPTTSIHPPRCHPWLNSLAPATRRRRRRRLIGPVLAVFLGKHLFDRAGQRPPEPSAHARKAPSVPISMFAGRQTHVIVLVLVIVAAAFGCQQLLLNCLAASSVSVTASCRDSASSPKRR